VEEEGGPFGLGGEVFLDVDLRLAKPKVTEEEDEVHLYAETGVASRFGVYVTHLSIIVIFIGRSSETSSASNRT